MWVSVIQAYMKLLQDIVVYVLTPNVTIYFKLTKPDVMRKLSIITSMLLVALFFESCIGPAEMVKGTTEFEGKEITTLTIGDQEWMAENLDVAIFSNGDPILHAETDKDWVQAGQNGEPAWCYYNNDPELGEKYGKLYNWYAVADPRGLGPNGWRVPDDDDWDKLIGKVGNKNNAGKRLKSIEGWEDNGNGENADGFNVYPSGGRYNSGIFSSKGTSAFFWSASDHLMFYGRYRVIHHNKNSIEDNSLDKNYGFAVRLVKDVESK